MSDNHQILKLFTRKLANCRYKVPVKSVIQYMDKGQFGYHIVEGEDTVVTNDSVFASSIASVITHIRAIFKDPHIFLKQEEIIQNIAVASHINNETLRMNYKDSKLWKTKALDTSPEFVHTFVYEDDYAIYENRFISFLMDELLKVLGKKISKIQEGIETFNWNITHRTDVLGLPGDAYLNYAEAEGGVPVIMATADVRVSVLESLLKSKKNLIALMQTPIYKACKKAGTFNELGLKLTNILLHDKHYNYCYEFYLNYLKRDAEFTSPSNMFNGFAVVNMICALNRIGFACENPDEEILISNSARVKFEKITFIREPFQIDMALGDKSDFSITVKNLVSGSSIQHFIKVVHTSCDELKEGATVEEIFQQYKAEANLEDRRAWLITDVEVSGEGVLHIQPANGNVIDLFAELLKKFTLLAEGSLSIYTSICPVCGSKFVSPDDKDYFCVDCDSVYHLFYYATRDLIWVKRLPKITDAFEVEKPVVEEIVEDEAVKEEPVVEEVVANETAKEEPVVEDVVAVTPVVEEAAAEEKTEKLVIEEVEIEEIFDEPAVEEKPVMDIDEILSNEAFASYIKRHFFAKVSHLEEEKKGYYNELKNYILQYKKISARASWNYETFSAHREARIRLAVRGKTLVAFFALDYKQYEDSKYFPKYMGDTKKYEDTPMMVKVQSSRGVKFAKELIDIVLADLEKNENYEAVDYTIPYKSDKQLYEEGLIKIVGNVSLSDGVRAEAVTAEAAIEEVVEETVKEEVVVEKVVEEVAVAKAEENAPKRHILGTITRHRTIKHIRK
ncbi:MAG: hypothetical protein E7355_05105 [Clostridiales bacterium]|nr:hypothetical protein [Clostridiales bacterium]